jgi:molecular chaperone GrpE
VTTASGDASLAELQVQHRDLYDRLLRTAAEFENWKKRSLKEHEEAAHHGRLALLLEIFPVLDNLERALQHAPEGDPVADGVRLVEKQLIAALEKFGVTRFDPLGALFDPALHEAVQQVETPEYEIGVVAQVFARGYMQQGRLVRAAIVGVAL